MKSLLLGFVFFSVFACYARYHYVCKIKHLCDDELTETPALDTDRPVDLTLVSVNGPLLDGHEHFYFLPSSAQPDLSFDNENFLELLSARLMKDSTAGVTITGFYRPSEREIRQGNFDNLGEARAAAVQTLLERRGIHPDRIRIDFEGATNENLQRPILFEIHILNKVIEE